MKEPGGLLGTADDVGLVPHLGDKGAVGHENLSASDGGAHEHPVRVAAVELIEADPRQAVALLDRKSDHLHPAPGKGLHAEGGGYPQQPGDLSGCRVLRVDDQVHPDLPLEEIGLPIVLRIADTAYGVLGSQLLGDEAADNIQLIGARYRHHQVRPPDAGLPEHADGGSAALHAQNIQYALGVGKSLRVLVDEHQIMVLAAELLGQGVPHLAVADDDDPHICFPSLSFSSAGSRPVL